jgi:hypothetical protein
MGEQQQNAMNESQLGQQKTLEDIATSKQNRDFSAQKQPLELEKMRGENTKTGLENRGAKTKLDQNDYTNYSNDVIAYAASGKSPMEVAAYQQQAAKRHNLDSNDERVSMVGGVASQGPEAIAKWKEVLLHMDPKYREEMDKQELANKGSRQNAEIHTLGSMYNADTAAGASRYASDQRLAAAQKRAGTAQDIVQAAMLGKLSYEKAAVALEMLAQQSDSPDEAARLRATAKDMEQRNLNSANARNQGGGVSIGQGGITERPPQAVVPPTAPLRGAQTGAPPVVAPQGGPPPGVAPQDQPQLAKPANKAERDALPPGTQYVGPDGQTYTKR